VIAPAAIAAATVRAEERIYPLIKCNRAESIQTAVNDLLTPAKEVIETVGTEPLNPEP